MRPLENVAGAGGTTTGHGPLVSIVVNNFNYGRFVGEAIESALAQDYPNTEVVVVDDGSTDGSRALIEGYGDRVVAVLKENGGQASAFNAGFAASRGDVVAFLDADDYLFPGAAGRVAAAWGPGVASVQYRLQKVDAAGNPTGAANPPRDTPMHSGEVWRTLLEVGHYRFPPTSGLAFDRRVLEEVLPVPDDYRIAADGYLAVVVPFHGRVVAIEDELGAYRLHGKNLWAQRDLQAGERFRGFVRHDLQKHALLARKAREMGHEVPDDLGLRHWAGLQTRLICLRLDPERHPISGDRPLRLTYQGLKAVWRYSGLPVKRRLKLSAWFAWVGFLPAPAAKPAIAWMFQHWYRPTAAEAAPKAVYAS